MDDPCYLGNVKYEVWANGGKMDSVDEDRVSECAKNGIRYDEAARIELDHQLGYD